MADTHETSGSQQEGMTDAQQTNQANAKRQLMLRK
jgi:hypothetical protein